MAIEAGNIKLDTAMLDKITAEMQPKASAIVERRGFAVVADWAGSVPVDTGAYRNSITAESHMEGNMTFVAQDGVEYGVFVELGTSRMAARPALVPALEKNRQPFYDDFKELFP